MAFSILELKVEMAAEDVDQFDVIAEKLIKANLPEVIDMACLDLDDLEDLFDTAERPFAVKLWERAKGFKHGWARLSNTPSCSRTPPSTTTVTAVPNARVSVGPPKVSTRSLNAARLSFTRRVILGKGKLGLRPPTSVRSLAAKVKDDMQKALEKVHVVFLKYAASSPRFVALGDGATLLRDMQLQSYRMGSRSPRVVAQRARASEKFFADCSSMGFDLAVITPFQVATWVRSRCVDGCKSAPSRCACTLRTVQWATDWVLHLDHPLVKSQTQPNPDAAGASLPAASAKTPSVEMVSSLEDLITTAPTPQLRCIAGFFSCLAFGATRFSDVQPSKDIIISTDSISGMSFMKNKKSWQRWYCSNKGFGKEWAVSWLAQLAEQGLPGPDFVLWAPNSSCDSWLPRMAEYHDMRRSLHFILHICLSMSVSDAVEYTPHSFRHFLVEAGQQLRALKECSVDDVERLGRWSKGSSMPDVYDNASGTSELMAGHTVLCALRSGWRPVENGCLPNGLPSSSFTSSSSSCTRSQKSTWVANRETRKVHFVIGGKSVTVCKMWSCGSVDCPSKNAQFDEIPESWSRCRNCVSAKG